MNPLLAVARNAVSISFIASVSPLRIIYKIRARFHLETYFLELKFKNIKILKYYNIILSISQHVNLSLLNFSLKYIYKKIQIFPIYLFIFYFFAERKMLVFRSEKS